MESKNKTELKVFLCCLSQRIRSTVDEKEQKQLLMDLDVVMRSSDCPYIVQFYGALFREVWLNLTDLKRTTLYYLCLLCSDKKLTAGSLFLGGLLDLYGAYVYLIRQILQICILCIRWRHSRGNIRQNNISGE